jgi:hypothetical protein
LLSIVVAFSNTVIFILLVSTKLSLFNDASFVELLLIFLLLNDAEIGDMALITFALAFAKIDFGRLPLLLSRAVANDVLFRRVDIATKTTIAAY